MAMWVRHFCRHTHVTTMDGCPSFFAEPPSNRTPAHCTSKETQHQTKISRYVSRSEIRGTFARGETIQSCVWISRRAGNRSFIHLSVGSKRQEIGKDIFDRCQFAQTQWQA